MRKSIYYLIANVFSAIGALIFIGVVNSSIERIYPYFGFDGKVFSTSTAYEPFKYILIVLALSIIYCAYDCVAASNHKPNPVPGQKVFSVIGGLVTVVTVLYTWVSVILITENVYATGSIISIPLWFVCSYAVGVVIMLLVGAISKFNDDLGAVAVLVSILIMVSGLINQLLVANYWYVYLITYGATLLIAAVLSIVAFALPKKAN